MIYSEDSIIFFHDPKKEYGFLSNWYDSEFEEGGLRYCSVEQYLMAHKAKLFGDMASFEKIMQLTDPHMLQAAGRDVTSYDHRIWVGYRQIILYKALLLKFRQNPLLLRQLLDTGNKTLVEATEYDKIYANMLRIDDCNRFDTKKWNGKNLLGFTLMQVREDLSDNQK